ncbi:MAG TPA: PAS domain S-box protein [Deltaproteobacteria bacterium]|nr:PAS domain S-box protein [Deltaproteobacteria bacterium]
MSGIYETIVENANEFIVVIQNGRIRFLNRKARGLPCFACDSGQGAAFEEYIHPDDRPLVLERLERRLSGDEVENVSVFRIVDPSGRLYWVEDNAVLIEWEGRPAVLNFITDITEQKRMETQLKESEERARLYLEHASDLIFVVDRQGRITTISPRVEGVIGYCARELLNKNVRELDILADGYIRKAIEQVKRVLDGQRIQSSLYEVIAKDGVSRYVEVSMAPLTLGEERSHVICVARDVTDRKSMEETLKRIETRYREFLEEIEDGYFEVNLNGDFTFFNSVMCRILGYPQEMMLGMNYRRFMDEATAEKVFSAFNQVYRTGEPAKGFEWSLIKNDGTACHVETTVALMRGEDGMPSGFRGTVRDVTEQKRLEAHLHQAQKMEALGTLAGGIAHDFNNILSGILGYAELALMDSGADEWVSHRIGQIVKACQRAKSLVNQILSFSRRGEATIRPVILKNEVEEALKLIRASIPSNIEIRTALGAAEEIVHADPARIHQIVVNLCTNAYHAVKQTGGLIEVRLSVAGGPVAGCAAGEGLDGARYVELVVEDSGCGMNQDTLERIFDPYFTTKPKGEGTGLGLAIVHTIVRDMGGAIRVSSIPGKGSSFHVYLPSHTGCVREKVFPTKAPTGGNEHVLVVDDERAIVDITSQMLKRLGYRVTAFMDSVEALEHFRRSKEGYDVVITDLTMPKMNGDLLAEQIVSIRPDIPVILCTGYSSEVSRERVLRAGVTEVLAKPVSLDLLAQSVRNVLDGR